MKFKELKALPPADLREKLLDLRKELMKENAQVAIGTVPKNPRKLRNAKKTIARIEMILSEQKRAEGPSAESRRVLAQSSSAKQPTKPMEVSTKA